MFTGLVNWLKQPSQRAVGLVLVGGFLAGFLFFVAFHFGMSATNSMDLCISCHEMEGVYQEYTRSKHYTNRSGVRADCADCHVPHGKSFSDWIAKFMIKMEIGLKDIYHHTVGTYPDQAAFEKERWTLAQSVLASMRSRDSKECRACHAFESMNFDDQFKTASKQHQKTLEKGDKTCVDCHAGIAHVFPEDPKEVEKAEKTKLGQ